MIIFPYTIAQPYTMMIHPHYASFTLTAMPYTHLFDVFALLAVFDVFGEKLKFERPKLNSLLLQFL